jgi:hypothetical protein
MVDFSCEYPSIVTDIYLGEQVILMLESYSGVVSRCLQHGVSLCGVYCAFVGLNALKLM